MVQCLGIPGNDSVKKINKIQTSFPRLINQIGFGETMESVFFRHSWNPIAEVFRSVHPSTVIGIIAKDLNILFEINSEKMKMRKSQDHRTSILKFKS